MEAEIPYSMSRLTRMKFLRIAANHFSGVFPHPICNLSSLLFLSIPDNNFFGKLRLDFDKVFPDIQVLFLNGNNFEGDIPSSLANISSLRKFDIADCHMTGSIPLGFGRLYNLKILGLVIISWEVTPPEIDFLSSLKNCTQLQFLGVRDNRLGGILPHSISNLSKQLTFVSLGKNHISGTLPLDIGTLECLVALKVEDNLFTGEIPASLGKLSRLENPHLESNMMSGDMPYSLGNLSMIAQLCLYRNSLKGSIPSSLRNCSYLLYLSLHFNMLSGSIPRELMEVRSLPTLDLAYNNLTGHFPSEVGKLVSLYGLDVSHSQLSGHVPPSLGSCLAMEYIDLNGNFFEGTIIDIRGLRSLQELDLSYNNLSGSIPEYLKRSIQDRKSNTNDVDDFAIAPHERVGYGELHKATCGFSLKNMIGSGNFGVVYKAVLGLENRVVSVKVLNLKIRGASKSFIAECEALKRARHRNLVKLITACSSIDYKGDEFRALVYEFLPNGSLDTWLHRERLEGISDTSRPLTLLESFNIAIDVASALEYLHVNCHNPIAHCDLKPSNVLLDDDLTAHVSDFGLARLLLKFNQEFSFNQLSSGGVRGTIGKKPTNELFGGNFTLHSYTKLALPERVLDIADKSILHSSLRVGFPIAECLMLVLELGLRCCEEFSTNRLSMSEAAKQLFTIRKRFFKARRAARG
ncbi:PREDICTED: probable LRR receptor-like serine/threonine-protein kinase At3g47570 [Brassica oleracea var. oleracea]|uniref:probable LRR receptor-like serine/threonine-protein kinase At3g47570 n=1 Tax=Brassica oleracea var. oleracea TaxID=109376 RepID=UPI0006A6D3F8|nr:PREDICTED: probable LRR receptor-like serine/threonine-protein kinase At3g47570 [Brassica oleracea var. oleracea]